MSNKSLKYQYHKNWKVNFETFDNYSQDFYILAFESPSKCQTNFSISNANAIIFFDDSW